MKVTIDAGKGASRRRRTLNLPACPRVGDYVLVCPNDHAYRVKRVVIGEDEIVVRSDDWPPDDDDEACEGKEWRSWVA